MLAPRAQPEHLIIRVVSFEWRSKSESARWRTFWTWCNTIGSAGAALVWGVGLANLVNGVAEALVADVLGAADGRSVLLITHRPEGLELVDEVVTLPQPAYEPSSATRRRDPIQPQLGHA